MCEGPPDWALGVRWVCVCVCVCAWPGIRTDAVVIVCVRVGEGMWVGLVAFPLAKPVVGAARVFHLLGGVRDSWRASLGLFRNFHPPRPDPWSDPLG